ncbi:MAG: hypothetical protein IPP69_15665 [Flavobacteriales bacterium]|nr:hypothetical protein [Flavobacteriales bacterium]
MKNVQKLMFLFNAMDWMGPQVESIDYWCNVYTHAIVKTVNQQLADRVNKQRLDALEDRRHALLYHRRWKEEGIKD